MLTHARLDSFYSALRQQIGDLAWPFDNNMRAARPGATTWEVPLPADSRSANSRGRSARERERAASANGGGRAKRNSEENLLLIKGEVDENVKLPFCDLYVEESGRIHGNVFVKRARISGAVSGDIEASEWVSVTATGRVRGSITAPRVVLEEKGTINGTLSVG